MNVYAPVIHDSVRPYRLSLPVLPSSLPTTDHRLPAPHSPLPTTDFSLPTAGCRLPAAYFPLPAMFLAFALALLLALALPPAQHAAAADFTVSTCTDGAFQTAVNNAQGAGGGTVRFPCDGTIALSRTITVTTALTLDATGHTVAIDGGNAIRLFVVLDTGTFTVMNLTLTNGNPGGDDGGAINSYGVVYITNSTLSNNTGSPAIAVNQFRPVR